MKPNSGARLLVYLTAVASGIVLLSDGAEANFVDSLPIISQAKSLVQFVFGDSEGARQTQDNFSRSNTLVAPVRGLYEDISGNHEQSAQTWAHFRDTWYGVAKGLPVVGHSIGVGHYIAGDSETGDEIMRGATRVVPVVAGGIVGGIVGGPVGGAAGAIAGGVAYDGVVTGIDAARKGRYEPYGVVRVSTNIINGETSAGEIFDTTLGIALDGIGGGVAGKVTPGRANNGVSSATKARNGSPQFGSSRSPMDISPSSSAAGSRRSSVTSVSNRISSSRRSSTGSLAAQLEELSINTHFPDHILRAQSAWERSHVNTNGPRVLLTGVPELPVTQFTCGFCTIAGLRRTNLKEILIKLKRMDIDNHNMALTLDELVANFKDAGFGKAYTVPLPEVSAAAGRNIPLSASPLSGYLSTAKIPPGTSDVFGLAYYRQGSSGSGHVVVLKAWRTAAGNLESRIIDFLEPLNSRLRNINNQVPSGEMYLIDLDFVN